MSADAEIVVTGFGVLCPLGVDSEAFWLGLLTGTVATRELMRFDTGALSASRGGEMRGLPPRADVVAGSDGSLAAELAARASATATHEAGLSESGIELERVGVCFGTVMGTRPTIERWLRSRERAADAAAGASTAWGSPTLLSRRAARQLGFGGPNCTMSTACAAGNSAIAWAADALRAGRADAMVAGGADEISQAMLMMFDSFRALDPEAVRPFDVHRRGLMLGEGAAALVLEREPDARARRAHIHGRVLGYANFADAHHITAPDPEGAGAARAMRAAVADAGAGPADVDHISAHGTGTKANDAVEARAIRRVFGAHADHIAVTATKAAIGHAQGAASAIEAVACLLALRDGLVPPTANHRTPDPACDLDIVVARPRPASLKLVLSNAFGFGGNIECVAFGVA